MFLGHHERLPQCADLLRKPWKYIVEIPFIPLIIENHKHVNDTAQPATATGPQHKKDIEFLFLGRVHLWAISRACAIRPWLIHELANRPRTLLIDLPEEVVYAPPLTDPFVQTSMQQSQFCLITRGDSYATATFYNAIQAGCLPVVISDWFVFSFWWVIPYEKFVVRIAEELFVSNPNAVLDALLRQYDDVTIANMQEEMHKWQAWLLYESVSGSDSDSDLDITPLNLLLVEIKAASVELLQVDKQKQEKKKLNDKNLQLACFDPIFCASRHKKGAQVFTISDSKIKNTFPYLCQHAPRLLGRYKIVYFQKCVKLLWPLRPGNVLKKDRKHGITPEEERFVRVFHNLSALPSSSTSTPLSSAASSAVSSAVSSLPWRVYPSIPEEASNLYHVDKRRQ